jgi:hypothetical protein
MKVKCMTGVFISSLIMLTQERSMFHKKNNGRAPSLQKEKIFKVNAPLDFTSVKNSRM